MLLAPAWAQYAQPWTACRNGGALCSCSKQPNWWSLAGAFWPSRSLEAGPTSFPAHSQNMARLAESRLEKACSLLGRQSQRGHRRLRGHLTSRYCGVCGGRGAPAEGVPSSCAENSGVVMATSVCGCAPWALLHRPCARISGRSSMCI